MASLYSPEAVITTGEQQRDLILELRRERDGPLEAAAASAGRPVL
jgi:hypothetical protein